MYVCLILRVIFLFLTRCQYNPSCRQILIIIINHRHSQPRFHGPCPSKPAWIQRTTKIHRLFNLSKGGDVSKFRIKERLPAKQEALWRILFYLMHYRRLGSQLVYPRKSPGDHIHNKTPQAPYPSNPFGLRHRPRLRSFLDFDALDTNIPNRTSNIALAGY
jgi:hypothetical protein